MKDKIYLEDIVFCDCGCGQIAEQQFKGVNIPLKNPMSHYREYMDNKFKLNNILDVREGAGYT